MWLCIARAARVPPGLCNSCKPPGWSASGISRVASSRGRKMSTPACRGIEMPNRETRDIGVALYGCGIVGTAVAEIIDTRSEWLRAKHGVTLSLRHIIVRDTVRERAPIIDRARLHAQLDPALRDPAVGIVVEAIGGIDTAGEVVRTALHQGKHVVTANKALLAAY